MQSNCNEKAHQRFEIPPLYCCCLVFQLLSAMWESIIFMRTDSMPISGSCVGVGGRVKFYYKMYIYCCANSLSIFVYLAYWCQHYYYCYSALYGFDIRSHIFVFNWIDSHLVYCMQMGFCLKFERTQTHCLEDWLKFVSSLLVKCFKLGKMCACAKCL